MNQLLLAMCLCSADLLARPCCDPPGYHGEGDFGGDMSFKLVSPNNPCYRGTMFDALKVVRAYRDNQAFAFHHFEGRRIQISGRLVQVRRDLVSYVAVDKDGKALTPISTGVPFPEGPVFGPVAGNSYLWSAEGFAMDVFTALVTPDGKPPTPALQPDGTIKPAFGLEFRFPVSKLDTNAKRCAVAALWAGQYVTLKGDCRGAIKDGEYTGIIFENAEIVP